MFRVLGCVVWQHDLRLVALAGVLCLFACVTAMSMLARARATAARARAGWLVAAGTVAGCGIWATHFVAMLAYEAGFPVSYDPSLTALSVVIAMTLCGLGFALAIGSRTAMLGGAIAGAAISAMHYVGMAAVRAPADAVWDARYVVASAIIGVALMAVGMRYAFRRDNWRWYLVSGGIFTVAICSMHFTGMTAVVYKFDPRVVVPDAVMAPTSLAIAVAAVGVLVVALGLIGALVDNHLAMRASNEANRLRTHVAELEATKEALEATSRNLTSALAAADAASDAKSRFLAAMSHELRTPLNAVIGFSEVLEMETFGPLGNVRYRDYVRDIHKSGKHLLALINDILDLTRLGDQDMVLNEDTFPLEKVAADAIRMVEHLAGKGRIRLSLEIESGVPALRADERRLKQVLLNLLSNAIKFTPPGGCVRLIASGNTEGVAIAISDTGIGIAQQDIPRVFERFAQLDSSLARQYEGTGLGLSLAKQLVELHGGTLTLESVVNVGTTATVRLPASRLVTDRVAA